MRKVLLITTVLTSVTFTAKIQAAGVCPENLCYGCTCEDGVVTESNKDGPYEERTYDIYGHKISSKSLQGSTAGQYTTYTYDAAGHQTSSSTYDDYDFDNPESNTPTAYTISTYDESGRKASKTIYREGGGHYEHVDTQTYYTYDENDRVIAETTYEKAGNNPIGTQTVYSYNENNDGYTETRYALDGEICHSYNKHGNCTSSSFVHYDTPKLTFVGSYDCAQGGTYYGYGSGHSCDHVVTEFDENGDPETQYYYAGFVGGKGDGFEDMGERDCYDEECTYVAIPSTTVMAYNANVEPVCSTGYGFGCTAGVGSIEDNSDDETTPASTKELKRIYTVEEASKLVKPTGNTFKIRYR